MKKKNKEQIELELQEEEKVLKKYKYINICLIIFTFLIILLLILAIIKLNNKSKFIIPEYSTFAKEGIVNDLKLEPLKINDGYSFYIEGNPMLDDNKLHINFVSYEDNKVLLRLRIYNKKNKVVFDSNIVKPGYYIDFIELDNFNENDEYYYKVMGYEFDTYKSAGAVKLNFKISDN